jgi:ABC-type phosphate transport system substrate-binding protein
VGESCLKPGDDAYPLARPLYVYTSPDALARYEVATFLSYAFSADGRALIVDADFIPPPDAEFRAAREALAEAAP